MAEGGLRRALLGLIPVALLLLMAVPTPTSAASKPPCIQSSSSPGAAPLSSVAPPEILWPCPGWDPIDNGVVTTRDVTGDGIAEIAVGIIIPTTEAGYVFLIDGARAVTLWARWVEHGITRMTFLEGPDYVVSESLNWGTGRGDGLWQATVYAMSLGYGGLRWTQEIPFTGKNHRNLIIAVPDVNQDGIPDVGVGTDSGTVLLSGLTGDILWQNSIGKLIHQVARMPDVDGDGADDVLATSHSGTCVVALSGRDGTVLWKYSASQVVQCVVDTFDLDGDGQVEVVVGLSGSPGRVIVLEGKTGNVALLKEVPWPDFLAGAIVGSPDLNSDGFGDIVLTNATGGDRMGPVQRPCSSTYSCAGTVSAFSGKDGSLIWSNDAPGRSPYALLRLPGEEPSFVAATREGNYDAWPAQVFRLDGGGQRLWTFDATPWALPGGGSTPGGPTQPGWAPDVASVSPLRNGPRTLSVPMGRWTDVVELVVGPDIDRNGTPDVLAVSRNLRLYAISDTGMLLWAFLP